MCSGGYPGNYEIGYEIQGLDKVKHSNVLFAGAEQIAGRVVTNSGRVLNVVATGRCLRRSPRKRSMKTQNTSFRLRILQRRHRKILIK